MARLPTSPQGRLKYLAQREGEGWIAKRLSGRNVNFISIRDVRLYERRDAILKNDGFLPWERLWLCTGSVSSGAMMALRGQRQAEISDYFYRYHRYHPKATYEEIARSFNRYMLKQYDKNGWRMRISGDPDPYAPLADIKDYYGIPDSPRQHLPRKKLPDYDDIVARTQAKEQRLTPAQRTMTRYAQKRGKE